ncbi:Aromatic amino acid aminotransferase [Lecanosticta acicola]|uniref:aromatic-amino-acid transaminase n=1 Tax=Lecanosticta acicola TaxID=111012 RepID=A0AAI9EE97_9PEZI|nr:Aromatic amino acid aminotransferase [Lecanosticta acicola]
MAPPAATVDVEVDPDTDVKVATSFALPLPDRLTIESVAKRRAASGKLIAGVAAPAHVEHFKGRTSHAQKPLARRWDHRLSAESISRGGSSLKNAASYLKTPGLISIGGGLPSSEYFPFDEISVKAPRLPYCAQRHNHGHGHGHGHVDSHVMHMGMHDMADGRSGFDIATAAQYGQGHGAAQLLRWLVEHTEIIHNPPYQDWSCTMTIGSTSAWEMALRMLTKPGDWILSELYTFATAVEAAQPLGVRVGAVGMDANGMLPASLDHVLTDWDEEARGGPKPFLIYTVPTGQNPTGSTQPIERRKEIYAVAQKHDLYLFEDEPYYFLQMEPYKGPTASPALAPSSHLEFLSSLVPSFLSLDTDGRVMRADSFSKVIAPGSRVGWITASEQLCQRYRTHADVSTQGPSGFSQLILYKLLDETWGHTGYLDWLIHMRMEYTRRRDVMLDSCERHLPRDIVSWVPPMAGMFHWLEIDWKRHPHANTMRLDEIEEAIFQKIVDHGTLLMKGSWFCADRSAPRDTMFFRATYAAAGFDQIDEATRRFGEALRDEFGVLEAKTKDLDGAVNGSGNGVLANGHGHGHGHGNGNSNGNGHPNGLQG